MLVAGQQGCDARKLLSSFVHRHKWLPAVVALAAVTGFAAALLAHATSAIVIAFAVCSAVASYFWGYSAHAFRQLLWAPLTYLVRRQYGQVWDSLMDSKLLPLVAEPGVSDEEDLGPSTAQCVKNLVELVGVGVNEDVLEIGCGAGRIAAALVPLCRTWTGADTSAKMLARAFERLRTIPNARLVQLRDVSLRQFEDSSFDVVYCTCVFGHLDEMDRWQYIREAFRVLRSGGRLLVDNIDVESDAGWQMFLQDVSRYQHLERPPYMPRFSTATELTNYLSRAGFLGARTTRAESLVIATASKVASGTAIEGVEMIPAAVSS
jgi:ubiquinone/menaquinone biosynthesis C-methylase UbiE